MFLLLYPLAELSQNTVPSWIPTRVLFIAVKGRKKERKRERRKERRSGTYTSPEIYHVLCIDENFCLFLGAFSALVCAKYMPLRLNTMWLEFSS